MLEVYNHDNYNNKYNGYRNNCINRQPIKNEPKKLSFSRYFKEYPEILVIFISISIIITVCIFLYNKQSEISEDIIDEKDIDIIEFLPTELTYKFINNSKTQEKNFFLIISLPLLTTFLVIFLSFFNFKNKKK